MPQRDQGQLIRLLRRSDLAKDIAGFVIDRQARGLSPRTIEFYSEELQHLRLFAEAQGVQSVQDFTPSLLRRYLLHLSERGRNPGGVHAAYRAMRAFLRWYEAEYEPQAWTNPIGKVKPPRVPNKPLKPVSLPHVKAMLATCQRRGHRA